MSRSLTNPIDFNAQVVQSEEELKEIFRPWVESGKALIKGAIASCDDLELSAEDLNVLESLTDPDIAMFALTMSTYTQDDQIISDDGRMIPMDHVRDCFFQAVVISDIMAILTALQTKNINRILTVILTRTQFISVMSKFLRGMSYVGLAIMAYEFIECVYFDAVPIEDRNIDLNEISSTVECDAYVSIELVHD